MAGSTTYYEDQLNKVFSEETPEYPRTIKIVDGNGVGSISTNWLGLNDESATELVKVLRKHYKVDKSALK